MTTRTAWVTLATNDGYAVGALVLAHSLRAVGTQHATHILFTDGVSPTLRCVRIVAAAAVAPRPQFIC